MKKLFVYRAVLTAIILGFIFCNQAVRGQDRAMVYTPEPVITGETVNISYDNSKTNLSEKDNIKAIVYFWQDWHWIASDLELKNEQGLWKASVEVPEDAGLIALKFVADGEEDCGGPRWAYVQLTQDITGQNLPSAYLAWGMLRNKLFKQEYGIPGYVDDTNTIADDVMLYWCNMELKYHPELYKDVLYFAAKATGALDKSESLPKVRAGVEQLIAQDSVLHNEEYIVRGIEIANNVLHDADLAKKLEDYALAAYPSGILARDKEIFKIFRNSDNLEQQQKQLADLVKKYPLSGWQDRETETARMYLGKIFQSVVYNQVIKYNNYDLLDQYIHELPYDYLYTFFWHMIQVPYRNDQLTAEQVFPHGRLLLEEAFNRERTEKQMVYSPKEWTAYLLEYRKESILDWAMILNETGASAKALECMRKVEANFEGKSAKFSGFYAELLETAGEKEKALEVIRTGIEHNAATPGMLESLKKNYVAQNGSDRGFDEYVEGLKSVSLTQEQEEKLLATIVNKPISLYELETLDGQKLNMADYKGKTIVLDFWATWCAPCKAAMPGMNMVYQKYKDDKDVVFFFISTMEFNDDYKDKIEAFLKEKKYDFTVLLDVPNTATNKRDFVYSQYAKTFGFSGIPQKLIIDPKGKLRWRSTGYSGSPSALADEISFLIEQFKN